LGYISDRPLPVVDALRYVDFFFLVAGFLAAFFGALAFLPCAF
jgi:hypothetical protein